MVIISKHVSNDHTYVCIHTYTRMHAYTYVCMHVYSTYVLHACMHAYILYLHMYTHTQTHMHTCVSAKDAFQVAHEGSSLEYSDMSGVRMTKQVRINSAQNLPLGA
jgi:hypothetical protein